ncbi:hypothetical protein L6164_015803 [Bauhinia variegata]|uniref:Uncharacterized protein n=1 Tax=Bauhinia variegata TaxID=167791 RepID=A0ACB9NLE3_BAUVA|nr:hypothetical protein L6164_015803 [Bauhinia variegata]
MKPGVSSLNPYAASYVPLSKREAADRTYVAGNDFKSHNGTALFQTPQFMDQHVLDSNAYATRKLASPEVLHVKSQPASSSYSPSSQNVTEMTEKQMLDEESEMDLEYLRMTFPGISDQSLADVYMVNRCDLEAAIDMLSQLEFDGVESSRSLPETLDIGDVSESGSSGDSTSLKLKNVAVEASTSSSPVASANVS